MIVVRPERPGLAGRVTEPEKMTCVVPEMTLVTGEALIMGAMIEPIGLAGEALFESEGAGGCGGSDE